MISARGFRLWFVVPIAILVAANVTIGAFPYRWGWKLGWNAHDMSWTGWPYRFIGYGGYFTHYEMDWLALGKSFAVWVLLSTLAGLMAAIVHRQLLPGDER